MCSHELTTAPTVMMSSDGMTGGQTVAFGSDQSLLTHKLLNEVTVVNPLRFI